MTNEMKLITALCERLGFEVEKTCVNEQERRKYILTGIGKKSNIDKIYEYKLTKEDHTINGVKVKHGDLLDVSIINGKAVVDKREQVEEPLTKLKESDEIFKTDILGEVRIGRFVEEFELDAPLKKEA